MTTLVANTYDAYNPGAIVHVVNMREFDYNVTPARVYRRNVTSSMTPAGTRSLVQMDVAGNVMQTVDQTGVISSTSMSSSTNYAAPVGFTDVEFQLCGGFVADAGDGSEWRYGIDGL